MLERVQLDRIVLDAGTQMRERVDEAVIAEYVEVIDSLPPIRVMRVGRARLALIDGFHRFYAHRRAERDSIEVEIIGEGSIDAARLEAARSNATHGLRRTNADKRLATVAVLSLRPGMSDREIGEHVGVSHALVGKIRREMTDEKPPEETMDEADQPIELEEIDQTVQADDAESDEPTIDDRQRIAKERLGVLLKGLDRWKAELDRVMSEESGAWIHAQSIEAYFRDLRVAVDRSKPAGLCPKCKGGGCRECQDLGWISRMKATVLKSISKD